MVSNALSVAGNAMAAAGAAARATTQGAAAGARLGPLEYAIAAVGLCALLVWIFRRLTRPRKLGLNNTPGRPNTLNPVHVIALYLLWQGATGAALFLLTTHFGELLGGPGSDKPGILAAAAGFVFLFGACLAVAAVTFPLGLRRGLGLSLRHWIYDTGRGLVGYLAVIPLCWALLLAVRSLLPPEQIRTHKLLTVLPELSAAWRAVVAFSAVVLAPLAEEVFFRGLLQSMLRRYLGRPWGAILVTSLLFAAVHGEYYDTVPALFVLGVALGYNYERCGRLYPSILIHMIFNGVSVLSKLTGAA